jgi:hypothetical protein
MAQLAEDGTMPLLLQAAYGPTMVNGDFWEPNNRAYMVGPSVKVHQVTHKQEKEWLQPQPDKDSRTTLWEASEDACGAFNSE